MILPTDENTNIHTMKVRCKRSNDYLIKDEVYTVLKVFDNENLDIYRWYYLENHTDLVWNTCWYDSDNFYSQQELRELLIKQLDI